jgi:hypothetical protein
MAAAAAAAAPRGTPLHATPGWAEKTANRYTDAICTSVVRKEGEEATTCCDVWLIQNKIKA